MASQLGNTSTKNWVKAALALHHLQNGLFKFVDESLNELHQTLIAEVKQKCKVDDVKCDKCSLDTLLPAHVKISCECPHEVTKCKCVTRNREPCQTNNVCSEFYDAIVKAHSSPGPPPLSKGIMNSPKRWSTDYWEIAKCILCSQAYRETNSSKDLDATGLLLLCIKTEMICRKVSNIAEFGKARMDRNHVMHTKTFELQTDYLHQMIDRMISILNEKEIIVYSEAKSSVEQLEKLKTGKLEISEEDIKSMVRAVIQLEHIANQNEAMLKKMIELHKAQQNLSRRLAAKTRARKASRSRSPNVRPTRPNNAKIAAEQQKQQRTSDTGSHVQVLETHKEMEETSETDRNDGVRSADEKNHPKETGQKPSSVDDMISLSKLNETSVLNNLLLRYKEKKIYTYIGTILIAVNPYEELQIYTEKIVREYSDTRIGQLPPHIFAIADESYKDMCRFSRDQCIIISGESGAGKTEGTKLILKFLTSRCGGGSDSRLKNQILASNPIMEAFGNARTIRNENSSRFGKYIKILFDVDGSICGAELMQYLLEKARVVRQAQGERNYHIFYNMIEGLSQAEKERLGIKDLDGIRYLRTNVDAACEGRNDKQEFDELRTAMTKLMFSNSEVGEMFKLLSAVLLLGNVTFQATAHGNRDDGSEIKDDKDIAKIASLLQVNQRKLRYTLTTITTTVTKSESFKKAMNVQQSNLYRDAFAKGIYGRVFIWIVKKINETICNPRVVTEGRNIGILDIFGFEIFDSNSFEQLCINYANETLQHFFAQQIFKLEQQEYEKERITWKHIEFVDNQDVLNLLAVHHMSIFALVDEESRFPEGSDKSLLNKLNQTHKRNRIFCEAKAVSNCFGIVHYAGKVTYQIKGFLEINRDAFSEDLLELIQSSKNTFLKHVFREHSDMNTEATEKKTYTVSTTRSATLGTQFRKSLSSLMTTLNSCHPFFVRCIKPNESTKANQCDVDTCQKQLRYMGMVETIKVRQAGYGIRHTFEDFVKRYRVLVKGIGMSDHKQSTLKICQNVLPQNRTDNGFQLGKSMVFLKNLYDVYLEQKRDVALSVSVVVLQKHIKMWALRKMFLDIVDARTRSSEKIQSVWRAYSAKKKMLLIYVEVLDRKSVMGDGSTVDPSQENPEDTVEDIAEEESDTLVFTDIEDQPSDDEDFDDFKTSVDLRYSFKQFADLYFQDKTITHTHTSTPISNSLLKHNSEVDTSAAIAVWTTVMRFMKDSAEPQSLNTHELKTDTTPAMEKLRNFFSISQDRITEHGNDTASTMPIKQYTLTENRQTTDHYKIHFVTGLGILRPSLRDEIYCQILKQLSENTSQISRNKGWMLLAHCLGCFPPSEKLNEYLRNFISYGQSNYVSLCKKRCTRTFKNGPRTQPPTLLEVNAAVVKRVPIVVSVNLSDNRMLHVNIDPASTARELCATVADKIHLIDKLGFSLLICQDKKVSSLGSGSLHVMDAISTCEQEAMEKGGEARYAGWNLYFMTEMFSPWHTPCDDTVATKLIYHQIIKSFRKGHYKCTKDTIAQVAAYIYSVNYGLTVDDRRLENIIKTYIPEGHISNGRDIKDWKKMVSEKINTDCSSYLESKERVVQYAKDNWPNSFCQCFTAKSSGQHLPTSSVMIAVNGAEILISDVQSRNILLQFSFPEIKNVYCSRDGCIVTFVMAKNEEHAFLSQEAEDISILVSKLLKGLRKRSRYVVAVKDYRENDDCSPRLDIKTGDLITLEGETGSSFKTFDWCVGKCLRTEKIGVLKQETVYIIPTIDTPTRRTLKYLKSSRTDILDTCEGRENPTDPYTLENFAKENFRQRRKRYLPRASSRRKRTELWQHSVSVIQKPHLQKLEGQDVISREACQCFCHIMMYMGDKGNPHNESPFELVDRIFEPPILNKILKDEVYCQIIRQVTNNPKRERERRGWELMLLITGCFAPSSNLLKDVVWFLKTRHCHKEFGNTAEQCTDRLWKTLRNDPRKHQPHPCEVDAVMTSTKLSEEITLPDKSKVVVYLEPSTKANDVCKKVGIEVGLKSVDGFGVYVTIGDTTRGMTGEDFVFDFLSNWAYVGPRIVPPTEVIQRIPKHKISVFKKIWTNTVPGKDKIADVRFHYPQELPKLLHGYHKCSEEDASRLAALIYRVTYNIVSKEDKRLLENIPKLMEEFIPHDLMHTQSSDKWIKAIAMEFDKDGYMTPDVAKIELLKVLYRWPTFGSHFFEVTQTTNRAYPEAVILVINNKGVSFMDTKTKDILKTYSFEKIRHWSSDDTYFAMTIGKPKRGTKAIQCDTKAGYTLEELLTTYREANARGESKSHKSGLCGFQLNC